MFLGLIFVRFERILQSFQVLRSGVKSHSTDVKTMSFDTTCSELDFHSSYLDSIQGLLVQRSARKVLLINGSNDKQKKKIEERERRNLIHHNSLLVIPSRIYVPYRVLCLLTVQLLLIFY